MLTIADAVLDQRICHDDCHGTIPVDERIKGIAALYHCDDALRGCGYTPIYELHGDQLWREAQRKNDPTYFKVAVRWGECLYRGLLGAMLHEMLHAALGDTSKANYGVPFGLPYGVPESVPPSEEEAYLATFNFTEARAWVGVWILGRALFSIDWDIRAARDIGTYGFVGGNALVSVPRGFRPVAHIDRQHHTERYYARGRKLEEEARAWFTEENLANVIAKVRDAATRGRATRPKQYPDPATVGRMPARKAGRNEPCTCGSAKKYKQCCAEAGPVAQTLRSLSR